MTTIDRLGPAIADRYRIDREIGAGGMATVYLAQDVRHDRRVALKVLNPELGAVLGVERFLAEIKVTANLQHPNLLPLFDSGEASGLLFYVMPYVEGESLRGRLDREKQLPIEEAVRIAVAIANALDYAHAHNVIHRDLKPENILLQAGQPVVADFGIALAVSNAGGNRITQTGLSLGTPQYMSPEQATGDRVIDGRTDIYSLGAMLYEMLTGEPPHLGNTSQAIIARLLTERPHSVRSTRPAVPEHIEAAVANALEKLPADRFSTAREFADALQGRGSSAATGLTSSRASVAAAPKPARWRDPVVIGLSVLSLASLGALAMAMRPEPVPAARATRFVMFAPDSARPFDLYPWPAAISPDGSTIVYSVVSAGRPQMLYAMRTDQLEGRPIPGTENAFQPMFSPDGQWLAFQVTGAERKVRLDGSAPVRIADGGGSNGADWSTSDELIVGATGKVMGLSKVSASGGRLSQFTHTDSTSGELQHVWPIALPDGKHVVFAVWHGTLAASQLAIASVDDGRHSLLGVNGIRPLAILDDHVVFLQMDGSVMAAPLDVGARTAGAAIPVHDPVPVLTAANGNSGAFISPRGAMIVARGSNVGKLRWLSPDGRLVDLLPDARPFTTPVISPDGRYVAMLITERGVSDVWIHDSRQGTLSRATNTGTATSVKWTSDNDIIYTARGSRLRAAVWRQKVTGGGPAVSLVELPYLTLNVSISPDSRSLLVESYRETTWDIYRVGTDSGSTEQPYLSSSSANEAGASFSPDGKWVALASDESGTNEVYVRSFPDPSARVQVSTDGGGEPFWSKDGSRLYYHAGSALIAARVTTSPTFSIAGRDTVVKTLPFTSYLFSPNFSMAADGRILGVTQERDDFQLIVSPNWINEFRERIARR
jgi:Tol biopolymer transport system component/tRNA A-37 threonylcarbamoyl transferase component Bud32